jgi:hypothetical protein
MSQENVQLVRAAFEAFLGDNRATRDTSIWDPDIELDCPEVLPDIDGVYKGTEAVLGWWEEWLAAWEVVKFDYQLIDAGDQVVALVDQRMRGRSSGIEIPMGKYAHILTYRNGLLVRWKFYLRQSEALKSVGLAE